MAKIIPFKALRYNDNIDLKKVTTPPYDVISDEEQDNFYKVHENNIIRLEYNKITETDTETDSRYTRSAAFLRDWMDKGILKFEEKPALYIYEEIFTLKNGEVKSFKGVMPLVKLEEFSKKIILPHEETLSKAKTDRFNLMSLTGANFSQIYCLYMDAEKKITSLIDDITKNSPDKSFVSFDGITQNLWIVTDEKLISAFQEGFKDKQLFIADGHHRYETALNFRNKMREDNPSYSENDLFNYVMMVLVEMDDPGLVVFPTHRMVKNLNSFDENDVLTKFEKNFTVEKLPVKNNAAAEIEEKLDTLKTENAFGFYTGKDYFYCVVLKNKQAMKDKLHNKSDAYLGLDVSILHTLILDEIFGIDSENLANQKNLVYTKQAEEAVSSVKDGNFECSFLLNPTKVAQIKNVSLANDKMPQKSTYFYPKIITGLVMNKFTD